MGFFRSCYGFVFTHKHLRMIPADLRSKLVYLSLRAWAFVAKTSQPSVSHAKIPLPLNKFSRLATRSARNHLKNLIHPGLKNLKQL